KCFQGQLGLFQFGKEFLFFLESFGMHAAAAAVELDRMLEVKHFVIDQILDGMPGYLRPVKNSADYDCVVRGIVVAEILAGSLAAPSHERTRQQAVKKAQVQLDR